MSPFGIAAGRVVLIGLGESNQFDELGAQAFGGRAWNEVAESGDEKALIAIDNISGSKLKASEISANAAYGVLLSSYRFDKYRTRE